MGKKSTFSVIKDAMQKPKGYISQKTYNEKSKKVLRPYIIGGLIAFPAWFYVSATAAAYAFDYGTALPFSIQPGLMKALSDPLYGFRGGMALQGTGALFMAGFVVIAIFMLWSWAFSSGRIHHDINTLKGSSEWADPYELSEAYGEGRAVPRSTFPILGKLKGTKKEFLTPHSNCILSKNFQMSLDPHINPKAVNQLILGTTGSGKSRYFLKPNLLQFNASFVITDPSGGILQQCGETLRRFGYNVRVFDINNMGDCSSYNPMKYCYTEADVKKLVNAFIKNTAAPGSEKGSNKDPFWDDSMNAFLCAIVSLLVNYGMDPEIMEGKTYIPCFANLTELTRMASQEKKEEPGAGGNLLARRTNSEQPTSRRSVLNAIFENVRKRECLDENGNENGKDKPYCLREWENFKLAPEKTSTTILMTTAVRLDAFNIDRVKDLTTGPCDESTGYKPQDTINLDTFGDQKDALFVIIPTNDRTYNFLAAFLYTQLFDRLYYKGEHSAGTASVKLKNGDLVKYFDARGVSDGLDKAYLEKIKDVSIRKVEVNGEVHGRHKKTHKAVTLDDSFYEILTADGEVVSRRPTMALAQEFAAQLKSAKIVRGNGQALPCHVRFLLDEFPNIGEIPEFKEKQATIRKYGISVCVICQTITQLKGMYPDDYEVVDANCPETIFLGGDENTNNEYISKKLGKATVIGANGSINEKSAGSHSYNVEERDLMKPEEIARMPYEKCLVMVYGEQPLYDYKFDYTSHKNYRFTQDYGDDCGLGDSYMVFDRTPYSDEIGHINPIDADPPARAKACSSILPAIHSMRITGDMFKKIYGGGPEWTEGKMSRAIDHLSGTAVKNAEKRSGAGGFSISETPIM